VPVPDSIVASPGRALEGEGESISPQEIGTPRRRHASPGHEKTGDAACCLWALWLRRWEVRRPLFPQRLKALPHIGPEEAQHLRGQ